MRKLGLFVAIFFVIDSVFAPSSKEQQCALFIGTVHEFFECRGKLLHNAKLFVNLLRSIESYCASLPKDEAFPVKHTLFLQGIRGIVPKVEGLALPESLGLLLVGKGGGGQPLEPRDEFYADFVEILLSNIARKSTPEITIELSCKFNEILEFVNTLLIYVCALLRDEGKLQHSCAKFSTLSCCDGTSDLACFYRLKRICDLFLQCKGEFAYHPYRFSISSPLCFSDACRIKKTALSPVSLLSVPDTITTVADGHKEFALSARRNAVLPCSPAVSEEHTVQKPSLCVAASATEAAKSVDAFVKHYAGTVCCVLVGWKNCNLVILRQIGIVVPDISVDVGLTIDDEHKVDLSTDMTKIAVVCQNSCRVVNVADGRCLFACALREGFLADAVTFSADGNKLFVSTRNDKGNVELWRYDIASDSQLSASQSRKAIMCFNCPNSKITSLFALSDDKTFIVSCTDGVFIVTDSYVIEPLIEYEETGVNRFGTPKNSLLAIAPQWMGAVLVAVKKTVTMRRGIKMVDKDIVEIWRVGSGGSRQLFGCVNNDGIGFDSVCSATISAKRWAIAIHYAKQGKLHACGVWYYQTGSLICDLDKSFLPGTLIASSKDLIRKDPNEEQPEWFILSKNSLVDASCNVTAVQFPT